MPFCNLLQCFLSTFIKLYRGEKPICFIINTRREEKSMLIAGLSPIPKGQSPQTFAPKRIVTNPKGIAVLIFERPQELSIAWIECIDGTVPKIADKQIIAERAKVGGCKG